MKLNKYIIPVVLLAGCIALPSCNDRLDIGQHGVTTVSNFYKTDADAEEAITACYDAWKGTFQPAFTVKNLISDDVNNGGESWSAGYYQVSTYTYDAGNSNFSAKVFVCPIRDEFLFSNSPKLLVPRTSLYFCDPI